MQADYRRILTTLFCVQLVFLFSVSSVLADTKKGLFIYWRGETECAKGFKSALESNGISIDLTEFNAEKSNDKLTGFLSTLDESKYDFIYTFGTSVSTATAKAVKNTPIFFGIVTNPLKSGLIQSWESSGNNVTGVSHAIPYSEQVKFILQIKDYKKIGMVYNPEEKNSQIANNELIALLNAKGIDFVSIPASTKEEIDAAARRLMSDKVEMVYLPSDSFVLTNSDGLIQKLNAAKIPTYGALKQYVSEKGALIGIVASYESVGQALADKAVKVFAGDSPSAVPSEMLPLERQTILVNEATATALNVEIPYVILESAKFVN